MYSSVWTPDLELGIPLFDEAHQALAEQIAVLQAGDDAEFAAGLAQLVDCLEADFRAEEELMEAIDYPAIQSHREQHARVLATLHGLDQGASSGSREAVALLLPWFYAHLATADTALAIALQIAGRAPVLATDNGA